MNGKFIHARILTSCILRRDGLLQFVVLDPAVGGRPLLAPSLLESRRKLVVDAKGGHLQ